MKLLFMPFYPSYGHFLFLRSKCAPQHHVLTYPRSIFFPKGQKTNFTPMSRTRGWDDNVVSMVTRLRAGQQRDGPLTPRMDKRFSPKLQTASGFHPTSYSMSAAGSFPPDKAAGT
jgi:hypothetical protein